MEHLFILGHRKLIIITTTIITSTINHPILVILTSFPITLRLGGVVVAYEKLRLTSPSGWLFDTNPFIHLRVSAHFFVFCPAAGKTLKGTVNDAFVYIMLL